MVFHPEIKKPHQSPEFKKKLLSLNLNINYSKSNERDISLLEYENKLSTKNIELVTTLQKLEGIIESDTGEAIISEHWGESKFVESTFYFLDPQSPNTVVGLKRKRETLIKKIHHFLFPNSIKLNPPLLTQMKEVVIFFFEYFNKQNVCNLQIFWRILSFFVFLHDPLWQNKVEKVILENYHESTTKLLKNFEFFLMKLLSYEYSQDETIE